MDDLERLEKDEGFTRLVREAEKRMLTRRERRALKERLRRGRKRTLPSPTAMLDWLAEFHDADEEAKRAAGQAFIPPVSKLLEGLMAANGALISFLQGHRPETTATLDVDAPLVATHKRQALLCYKKFKAYQPRTTSPLQRRLHQRARADPVAHTDRAPAALPGPSVDAGVRRGPVRLAPADRHPVGEAGDRRQTERQIVLNFITPHQKWGIHSTYTDNLLMLTLSRGGPIVWISEKDAAKAGIVDNDWIEAYNANGALVVRAAVSQRVKEGMCLMYHAQEKIVNVPGSEMTGRRGASTTR